MCGEPINMDRLRVMIWVCSFVFVKLEFIGLSIHCGSFESPVFSIGISEIQKILDFVWGIF